MAIVRTANGAINNGTSTNPTCTWAGATGAGSLLIAILTSSSGTTTFTPPAGWTLAKRSTGQASGTPSNAIYYIENAASRSGAETWTVNSFDWFLQLLEYTGIATASSLDVTASAFSDVSATPVASGTTAAVADTTSLAVAGFASLAIASAQHGSPANGFSRITNQAQASGKLEITSAEKIGSLTGAGESSSVSLPTTTKKNSGVIAVFKPASTTPPTNTVAPTVTPTIVTKGVAETGTDGTWTGSPSFTYQWFRADDAAFSVNVTSIGSATAASYTPATADVSKYLRLTVTGTNAGGSASAVSNVVGKVSIIAFDASAGSGYKAASSSYTFTHSLGAIGSGLLLVQVAILTVAGSVSSLTASLTISGSTVVTAMDFVTAITFGAYRVELWALATGTTALAPQTSTITVNLNALIASIASSVSYANVDQTEPTAEIASSTGTGNPGTVTVVPIQDQDWVVDAFSSSDTAVTVGSGQVSRQNQTGALGSLAVSDKGPVTPAASTNMQWTAVGVTDTWAYVAAAVQPLGAGNDWTIPRLDGTIDLCANDTIVTYTLAGAGLPHERLLTGVGT